MVSPLKTQDLPEPWLAPKKSKATTSRQKTVSSESPFTKDSPVDTVVEEHTKRGRGRPKAKPKMTVSAKGKGRSKSLSTSAADVILGRTKTSVADVEERRRKREEDTVACGRQVRSVLETRNRRRSTIADNQINENESIVPECQDDVPTPRVSPLHSSPLKSSKMQTSTEYHTQVEDDAAIFLEERNDVCDSRSGQRSVKKPLVAELHQSAHDSRSKDSTLNRQRGEAEVRSDLNSESTVRRILVHQPTQSPPEPLVQMDDRRRGREIRRDLSVEVGPISHTARYELSTSRSPDRNYSRISRTEEYRSGTRSVSCSPGRWRGGRQQSVQKLVEFHENSALLDEYERDYRMSNKFSNMESRHTRRYDSASPHRDIRRRRSRSPVGNERVNRRSSTRDRSRSPPTMLTASRIGCTPQWTGLTSVKEEGTVGTCQALSAWGRRERRHDLAVREEDMASRQKQGKKTFYLTLDPEGKPYGPGKPAWVAQINKLAAGLDPSCTHIRKQTFEDVQTLKDRLNEDFDYSGKLNEDHLRGLMGKAVTKRRGELISLIKSNGKQPYNIDYEVWRRLEKLAYSKQREEKTEQGRYANSCRKTLGRTGAKGVNGVREKLRSILRRSPHPDEVEEEMQRDKGFGGQKKKRRIESATGDYNVRGVLLSDEDTHSLSIRKYDDRLSSDADDEHEFQRHPQDYSELSLQRIGRGNGYAEEDVHARTKKSDLGKRSLNGSEPRSVSKDDYIETLKAEIYRLQLENENASTSKKDRALQSPLSQAYSARERGK